MMAYEAVKSVWVRVSVLVPIKVLAGAERQKQAAERQGQTRMQQRSHGSGSGATRAAKSRSECIEPAPRRRTRATARWARPLTSPRAFAASWGRRLRLVVGVEVRGRLLVRLRGWRVVPGRECVLVSALLWVRVRVWVRVPALVRVRVRSAARLAEPLPMIT